MPGMQTARRLSKSDRPKGASNLVVVLLDDIQPWYPGNPRVAPPASEHYPRGGFWPSVRPVPVATLIALLPASIDPGSANALFANKRRRRPGGRGNCMPARPYDESSSDDRTTGVSTTAD
jgi:hypothetical protein